MSPSDKGLMNGGIYKYYSHIIPSGQYTFLNNNNLSLTIMKKILHRQILFLQEPAEAVSEYN